MTAFSAEDVKFEPAKPLGGQTDDPQQPADVVARCTVPRLLRPARRGCHRREELIGRYEIGLGVAVRDAGLNLGVLVRLVEIGRRITADPAYVSADVRERFLTRRGALNATHAFWRETLELGSPFL